MRTFVAGSLLTIAVAAISQPAYAGVIAPAEYSASLCSPTSPCANNALSGPGTITLGSSTLTISANPSPSITVSVSGNVTTGSGSRVSDISGAFASDGPWDKSVSYAGLQYYATILGPNNGLIPVDLAYTITLTVSGVSSQDAAWIALNPSNPISSGYISPCPSLIVPLKQLSSGAGSSCDNRTIGHVTNDTISGVLTENIAPNTVFDIGELVRLEEPGYASVDPILYIDPSFADTDPNYLTDYSILLSPGVGNTEDVPEPLTLSMFAIGAMCLVTLGRRRKAGIVFGGRNA